jgi:hypothetical protein
VIAYTIYYSDGISVGESSSPTPGVDGASLYDDVNISFVGVNFSGSGDGILATYCDGVLIENSELFDDASGVVAELSNNLTILGSDLAGGNNGLYADDTTSISVQDSNLSRANYPLNLTDDTRDVSVGASDLDNAQFDGAYLNGVSNVSIQGSTVRSAANDAVYAVNTQGLVISSTNLSGSPARPGLAGIATTDDTGTTLFNDSLEWMTSPVVDVGSFGLRILGSDLSNVSDGGTGVSLTDDQQVQVANSSFFNDSGNGVTADTVTDLTVQDSDFDDLQENGVALEGAIQASLLDNSFNEEGGNGVFLVYSQTFEASGNTMNNDSYAFFLSNVGDVVLVNNTALADQNGGLAASDLSDVLFAGNNFSNDSSADTTTITLLDTTGLSFIGNILEDDFEGLLLSGTSDGTIVGNGFQSDNISFDFDGVVQALVYHNDFLADQGWEILDVPLLAWDDGYPVGGNYWSNYTGVDQFSGPGQNLPGADGLGDTPFVLDAADSDYYPLMTPWTDHAVTFVESGLPIGTPWTVVVNGTTYQSTSNAIAVISAVGTLTPYQYSIPTEQGRVASPSSGSGTFGSGSQVVGVTFAVPEYSLNFTESGLPSGVNWSVTVNGGVHSSNTGTLALNLTNGSYSYSVIPVAGYLASPMTGSVTITGGAQSVELTFQPVTYGVTVVEAGLPAGTSWGFTIGATTRTVSVASLSLSLANGTYTFTLTAVTGYTATPAGGTLTVSGGPVTFYLSFVSNSTGSPGSKSTVTSSEVLGLEAGIAALVVIALIGWALAVRRRPMGGSARQNPATPPPPPPPGAS